LFKRRIADSLVWKWEEANKYLTFYFDCYFLQPKFYGISEGIEDHKQ